MKNLQKDLEIFGREQFFTGMMIGDTILKEILVNYRRSMVNILNCRR